MKAVQLIYTGDRYEIASAKNSELPEWPVGDSALRWYHEEFPGQRVAYTPHKIYFGFCAVRCEEGAGLFTIDGVCYREVRC